MIAHAKPGSGRPQPAPDWHRQYLAMLPAILRRARLSFRHLDPESRAEAIQEVMANTWMAFARLVELGKTELAYAGPLAGYAVAQIRVGRRVGCRVNVRDVLSPCCRRLKRVQVERLDRYHRPDQRWLEAVVEDPRTSPADQAAFRIDFPRWLGLQTARNRQIAEAGGLAEPCCSAFREPGKVLSARHSEPKRIARR